MILQDSTVERDLASCLTAGATAEWALSRTLDKYVATFQKLTSPFFQERIFDIKDVFRRILWHLRPQEMAALTLREERIVLVVHEASVLDLFSVDLDHLVGVIVEHGGPHSHAVIIARSLGIPMVGQVSGVIDQIVAGQLLRVDGGAGRIDLDPSLGDFSVSVPTPHLVFEHCRNVEILGWGCRSAWSAPGRGQCQSPERGREGTGQRGKRRGPLSVGNALPGPPNVTDRGRTGGDLSKTDCHPQGPRHNHPHLRPPPGQARPRGNCCFVDGPDDGLAAGSGITGPPATLQGAGGAILRAAAAGPVRLLIPLVTRSRLLDFVIRTVEEARLELIREELEFGRNVPLGIMIEVAAVVPLVDAWSERVEFFSLGTNDLIASALGIDRDDPVGTLGDDILHPGLIRIIGDTITSAHRAGRPVSVCGEMASDRDGAVVLAALAQIH